MIRQPQLRSCLVACLVLGFATAAAAGDKCRDLLDAVADGDVTVEAHCIGGRTLRITISNPTTRPVQVAVKHATLAVPAQRGVRRLPVVEEAAPFASLVRRAQLTVGYQIGAVGGHDEHGGFGGPRKLFLKPAETQQLDVPFLATELSQFRPDRDIRYTLVAAPLCTDDARQRMLLEELTRHGASFGVAQAAWWHLVHKVPLRQLRLLRHYDINDEEMVLAEHLVSQVASAAQAKEPKLEPVPARLYLQIINRAGGGAQKLITEMENLTTSGGLLGLPVRQEKIEDFVPQDIAQLATAIGCQLTFSESLGKFNANAVIVRWDGRTFHVHKQVFVDLGAEPTARDAVLRLEAALLKNLIELKPTAPKEEGSMYGVEVINHFPLALRTLRMRLQAESTAAVREITLTDYCIGPNRRVAVDVGASAWNLHVIGAAWGR